MNKSGFTLFLSLLVVSALLSVSLGVFDIVLREIRLSNFNYQSQIAFYASNTGIECALYWDIKQKAISTTDSTTIECAGRDITTDVSKSPIISFHLDFDNDSCADVEINKSDQNLSVVRSYGYNICGAASGERVRRGLQVIY